MHYGVQHRHLHYTDVILSHIRISLGLDLGLEEWSLESKPGFNHVIDPHFVTFSSMFVP